MKQNFKIFIGTAVFVFLMATAVFAYNALSGRTKPDTGVKDENPGVKMSDFTMTDQDGNSVKLSEMTGKPIVLNFWASWCPPCKVEMPDFEKVFVELGEEVQFMMVNLTDGFRETKNTGSKYIGDEGYTFPVFFDDRQEGASAYGIRSIPTTFFIDKDGYVVDKVIGTIDEDTLRQGIYMAK